MPFSAIPVIAARASAFNLNLVTVVGVSQQMVENMGWQTIAVFSFRKLIDLAVGTGFVRVPLKKDQV